MPVIAICSKERHKERFGNRRSSNSSNEYQSSSRATSLDLHTSEAPIEISSSNAELSLQDLGLADMAINGVINIYVVERKFKPAASQEESGKDAIFLDGDAWVSLALLAEIDDSINVMRTLPAPPWKGAFG